MKQLDLFNEIDDFNKELELNTRYILEHRGYDINATYEILRYNYAKQRYELVVFSQGKEISVRGYKSISECADVLYEELKDREYEYSVEVNGMFVYYCIHKLID